METTITESQMSEQERLHRDEPDLKHRAGEAAQQVGKTIRANARDALDKARHSTMEALGDQKRNFAERVRAVSHAMSDAAGRMRQEQGDNALCQGTESFAHRVDSIADYLERKDLEEMAGDARDMIRRHPAIAFGAMFAAGLFLGRFLKATEPGPRRMREENAWQEPAPMNPASEF